MKIKNLYLTLIAVIFIASSCSENPDLDPTQFQQEILSQGIDDQRSEWVNNWNDCNGDDCSDYTWVGPGAYIDFDANTGSGTTSQKIKSPKSSAVLLIDTAYWNNRGYNTTEMIEFFMVYQQHMSNSEWSIFSHSSVTDVQRSKYVLNARIAIDKAEQHFPDFKRNSKGDALRQGIASALNADCLGVTLTKQLQDAHYTRSINPYHAKEILMMQDNDAFGRGLIIPWAPPSSTNTLIGQVVYARANGGLYYLTPLTNYRPNPNTQKVSTRDSSGGPGAGDDCDDGDGSAGGVVGMC